MNEVNKTLFIPLYGKAQVSQKGIILHDPTAERIWKNEAFPNTCFCPTGRPHSIYRFDIALFGTI